MSRALRPASAERASWIVLVVLLAAGSFAAAGLRALHSDAGAEFVELHQTAPAMLAPFLDEREAEVSLESYRGKVLILNLWAPWCAPCLQEMPALDRLAARLPEARFAVAAVTKDPVGDTPSKRAFDAMGLSRLRLYLDPKGLLQGEVAARGFPTTVIIGPDGVPVAYREGAADWDSPEMIARLEKFAAPAAAARGPSS
jgi:thiol-disulfide isomerase/thioredoxin